VYEAPGETFVSPFVLALRFVGCLLTEVVVVQPQAKANALVEPILTEVPPTAAAEDGPGGEGANAEATDGAPAPEDQITGASSSRAAVEV